MIFLFGGADMDSKNQAYINHEVRIQLLERMMSKVDNKMSVALTLILSSIILPIILKWLGWA